MHIDIKMQFDGIIKDIVCKTGDINVIFCSVGCSANLKEKNKLYLTKDDRQQFPPFLQNLYSNSFLKFMVILVDPTLEEVPDCINYINGDMCKWNDRIVKDRLTIIPHRKGCCYNESEKDDYMELENILLPLKKLANHCIDNNILLFMHDFSGRDLPENEFKEYTNNHSNLIRFDLAYGLNYGCYVNLLDDLNVPLIEKNDFGYNIFDPRKYMPHNILNFINQETNTIKKKQTIKYMKILVKQILNELSITRSCLVNMRHHNPDDKVSNMIILLMDQLDNIYGNGLVTAINNSNEFGKNKMEYVCGIIVDVFRKVLLKLYGILCDEYHTKLFTEIHLNNILTNDIYSAIRDVQLHFNGLLSGIIEEEV